MPKKSVVHFVGTSDVIIITGDWFDRTVFNSGGIDYWQFVGNKHLINMSNVTYIEVVDDGK